jgi:hypothetical protein
MKIKFYNLLIVSLFLNIFGLEGSKTRDYESALSVINSPEVETIKTTILLDLNGQYKRFVEMIPDLMLEYEKEQKSPQNIARMNELIIEYKASLENVINSIEHNEFCEAQHQLLYMLEIYPDFDLRESIDSLFEIIQLI